VPVTVILGGPIPDWSMWSSFSPLRGLIHRTIDGHRREVSNLDYEVRNPDCRPPNLALRARPYGLLDHGNWTGISSLQKPKGCDG
jgi:hypothetical protein